MPHRIVNLERELKRFSAQEDVFAFSELAFTLPDTPEPLRGLLLISIREKADEAGQLDCTFLLDIAQEHPQRALLDRLFARLAAAGLDPLHGQDFEYMTPLEVRETPHALWFVQVLHFTFAHVRQRARRFVEARLLPSLSRALPVRFNDLSWWRDPETELGQFDSASKSVA